MRDGHAAARKREHDHIWTIRIFFELLGEPLHTS
jgi:hypothetical protein